MLKLQKNNYLCISEFKRRVKMPSFLHFCCLFVAQIIDKNSYTIDSQSITDRMIDFASESSEEMHLDKSNTSQT